MISCEMTQTQKQVRDLVHYFAEHEMRPISMLADKEERVPDDWLAKVNRMGITLSMPGSGTTAGAKKGKNEDVDPEVRRQTNRLSVIAAEEMGWGDPAIALTLPGPGLGGPPVQASGTPEQRERFLSIFTKDEPRWGAYALTEPGAGSDVAGIRTSAKKVDGGYVLNGQKIFITNGGRASWVVVFATVDPSLGRAGHRAFVVEKGTAGFSCTPHRAQDGHARVGDGGARVRGLLCSGREPARRRGVLRRTRQRQVWLPRRYGDVRHDAAGGGGHGGRYCASGLRVHAGLRPARVPKIRPLLPDGL